MLISFSTSNYRSINEKVTFSMVGRAISDTPSENIIDIKSNKLLKSAVLYGANSSGKSNLVRAINEMNTIVLTSIKLNDNEELSYEPFLFSKEEQQPTLFEVEFLQNEQKFRYGFELTSEKIISEWFYKSSLTGREKELFYRELNRVEFDKKLFKEGENKEQMINSNRLFISLCAQLGGEESKKVLLWFQSGINIISGISTESFSSYSKQMFLKQLNGCVEAQKLFKKLQLGFKDLECTEVDFDETELPNTLTETIRKQLVGKLSGKKHVRLRSIHNIYDNNGEISDTISLDFNNIESEGTKKLFELSGPIFDTLLGGKTLVIDELDAKLHPHITYHIVNLFNSSETNPNGAQLIFTTHDTNLLSANLFRRDQIWFTEKDRLEQTDLYNMMDIVLPDNSTPRKDANYEKNYIAGRYGAIPYIIND